MRNDGSGNHSQYRRWKVDPTRHAFQTKLALGLAIVTLVGMFALSAVISVDRDDDLSSAWWWAGRPEDSRWTSSPQAHRPPQQQHRWLEDQDAGDDNGGGDNNNQDEGNNDDDGDQDYSMYSCNHLYSVVPDRGEAQCRFARSCNQGAGVWAPFVFCAHSWSLQWMLGMLTPFIVLWLLVLFRLLGSTAEDYFSPALEMLAVKLGLPPRFAGVTLLALGNGAADVSATVSAISNDPQHGYLLSLGALTGAAMVISSVVSALVVLVAGGVPCRGALVRDVVALGVSVLIVWFQLGGASSSGGLVGPDTVTLFLSLYALFVLTVLLADVYHRAVVLPRRALRAQEAERQRQLRDQELHEQQISQHQLNTTTAEEEAPTSPMLPGAGTAETDAAAAQAQPRGAPTPRSPTRFSTVLTAFSNYDNDQLEGGWDAGVAPEGEGVDSDELAQDRPILLHGTRGILNTHKPPTSTQGDSDHHQAVGGDAPYTAMDEDGNGGSSSNFMMMEAAAAGDGTSSHAVCRSWKEAWDSGVRELERHSNEVWDDIAYNGDVDMATKALLILELPFVILRKVTVPIPCEGFYVRALVALSLAVSPAWMAFYAWNGHEALVWHSAAFWVYWGVVLVAAAAWLRYAPAGSGDDLSLYVATPVALYGFAVAATWIDTVADALVSLLDFIGIVLRIPGPLVGLTILAWGNSMSDLSANVTMARKGLANMAMTACFAGPFFNILVGLGLGFSKLAAQTGVAERQVYLQPSISAGFWFLALNSLAMLVTGLCLSPSPQRRQSNPASVATSTGGRIPKKYGYIALTLYSIYLISAITLQYTKKSAGDEE